MDKRTARFRITFLGDLIVTDTITAPDTVDMTAQEWVTKMLEEGGVVTAREPFSSHPRIINLRHAVTVEVFDA